MNFESHIKDHKPTVVEFYADWSKLSNLLVPVMHEVKETAGDRATVLRINIDHDKNYAEDYQVYTVPTIIIFKEGNIFWRNNGISSSHEILQHLNQLMK